jgi:hypothetical protein
VLSPLITNCYVKIPSIILTRKRSILSPTAIYLADWGTAPNKRWVARAVLEDGHYAAFAPAPVGDQKQLLQTIRPETRDGCALVGFDFPIGIPASYAQLIGISKFKPFLLALGEGHWSEFFDVCKQQAEISHSRPFYPHKPGGTKQAHLWSALRVTGMDDLPRRCERAYDGRRAACSLFWTLGAAQVGKAAICGWRDVIIPALGDAHPPML